MCRMVSLEYTTSYDSGASSQLVMSAISKVTCTASASYDHMPISINRFPHAPGSCVKQAELHNASMQAGS